MRDERKEEGSRGRNEVKQGSSNKPFPGDVLFGRPFGLPAGTLLTLK
jgi:hypothetical protein